MLRFPPPPPPPISNKIQLNEDIAGKRRHELAPPVFMGHFQELTLHAGMDKLREDIEQAGQRTSRKQRLKRKGETNTLGAKKLGIVILSAKGGLFGLLVFSNPP